jgi:hypothetical protein
VSAGLRAADLRRQRGSEPRSARLPLPNLLARILGARRRDTIANSPVEEL